MEIILCRLNLHLINMKRIFLVLGIALLIALSAFGATRLRNNTAPSNIQADQPKYIVNGTIEGVKDQTVSVIYGSTPAQESSSSASPKVFKYQIKVSQDTKITTSAGGKAITINDLKKGQSVSVVSKVDLRKPIDSFEAKSIAVAITNSVSGSLIAINGDIFSVKVELPEYLAGQEYQFKAINSIPISASIPEGVQNPFSGKISLSDLRAGMEINVLTDSDIPTNKDLRANFINIILK
jgi:hypothetical protein